jgi:hypothetical protein
MSHLAYKLETETREKDGSVSLVALAQGVPVPLM